MESRHRWLADLLEEEAEFVRRSLAGWLGATEPAALILRDLASWLRSPDAKSRARALLLVRGCQGGHLAAAALLEALVEQGRLAERANRTEAVRLLKEFFEPGPHVGPEFAKVIGSADLPPPGGPKAIGSGRNGSGDEAKRPSDLGRTD